MFTFAKILQILTKFMLERLIPFEKYEGAGNDFIILDFFEKEWVDLNDSVRIAQLCHRNFGIGADGLIAVCPVEGFDFEMKYLNSDGRFSTFCGNGSRCAAAYFASRSAKQRFLFKAADGPHEAELMGAEQIKVKMKDLGTIETTSWGQFVHTGSPHIVLEVDQLNSLNVFEEGRRIRNGFSPEGTNVNFISLGENSLKIRTYERGVENETLACGTGITAAAFYLASKLNKNGHHSIHVEAQGGTLVVELDYQEGQAKNVFLIGPAKKVFMGFL